MPLARQNQQIDRSETYKDSMIPKKTMETNSTDLQFDLNAIRTQIRNITGESSWFEEPIVSIKTLYESENRLWYYISGDIGTTNPTSESDTLGIKGSNPAIISTSATDSGQDTIEIQYIKDIFRTISCDNSTSVTAESAQETIFFISGDEISATVGENQVTITFSGTEPQAFWGDIYAFTREVGDGAPSSAPGVGWTLTSPSITQDTLVITGNNGIVSKAIAVASPESDTVLFQSQDFTEGTGDPEFVALTISSLEENEILYINEDNFLVGDDENFVYVRSIASVGIGTGDPEYNLHVIGNVKIHDESFVSALSSLDIDNPTHINSYGDYIIIFVDSADNIAEIYDDMSILQSEIKSEFRQSFERRIVRASAVRGKYLFTVADAHTSGDPSLGYFDIWDMTDIKEPTKVSTLSSSSFKGSKNIEISGRYVYFASANRLVNIIDIFDIDNPVIFDQSPSGFQGGTIRVDGRKIVVTRAVSRGTTINSYLDNDPNDTIDFYQPLSRPYSPQLERFGDNYAILPVGYTSVIFLQILNEALFQNETEVTTGINENKFFRISGNRMYVVSEDESGREVLEVFLINRNIEEDQFSLDLLYSFELGAISIADLMIKGSLIYVVGSSKTSILQEKGSKLTSSVVGTMRTSDMKVYDGLESNGETNILGGLWVGPGGVHVDEGAGISTDSDLNIKGSLFVNTNSGSDGIVVESGNTLLTAAISCESEDFYEAQSLTDVANHGCRGAFYKENIIVISEELLSFYSSDGTLVDSITSDIFTSADKFSFDIQGDYLYYCNEFTDLPFVVDLKTKTIINEDLEESGDNLPKIIKVIGPYAIMGSSTTNKVWICDISDHDNVYLMDEITLTGMYVVKDIDCHDDKVYILCDPTDSATKAIVYIIDTKIDDRYTLDMDEVIQISGIPDPISIKIVGGNALITDKDEIHIVEMSSWLVSASAQTTDVDSTNFFSGNYLFTLDTISRLTMHDYTPFVRDNTIPPYRLNVREFPDLTIYNVLSNGQFYFIFHSEGFSKYAISNAEFDTMKSGYTKSNDILVKNNLETTGFIRSGLISIGGGGLRVQGDMEVSSHSSFFGKVSVDSPITEHQFYSTDKGFLIKEKDGEDISRSVSTTESLQSNLFVSDRSGGYAFVSSESSSIPKLYDIRYNRSIISGIGEDFDSDGYSPMSVSMKGDMLFLYENNDNKILVYDISNKSVEYGPVLKSSFTASNSYTGSIIFSKYLVLWDGDESGSRIDFYDTTDSSSISLFSENEISATYGKIVSLFETRNKIVSVFRRNDGQSYINVYNLSSSGGLDIVSSVSSSTYTQMTNIRGGDCRSGQIFLCKNTGVYSSIISMDCSDISNISYISEYIFDSSINYPYSIKIFGKYAILYNPAISLSSNEHVVMDVSNPESMAYIFDGPVYDQIVRSIIKYGNKIIVGEDNQIEIKEIIGYRGQFGSIGSIAVDDFDVSEDLFGLKKLGIGSFATVGSGGVNVGPGNGISTSGKLVTTGKAGFGTSDLSNYDISIKEGNFNIEFSDIDFETSIDTYSGNTNNGFLFEFGGSIFPTIKNRLTKNIIVSGHTKKKDEDYFLSSALTSGFDGFARSQCASSGLLFKLNTSQGSIFIYEIFRLRESVSTLYELDMSGEGPKSIALDGNRLFVLSSDGSESKVSVYVCNYNGEGILLEKKSELAIPDCVSPRAIAYGDNRIYIGDESDSGTSLTTIDISSVDNPSFVDIELSPILPPVLDVYYTPQILDMCISGNFLHILAKENDTFYYNKININSQEYLSASTISTIDFENPKKIENFGKFVAIMDSVSSGNDIVYIIDSSSSEASLIAEVSSADLEDILDIMFYSNSLFVLGKTSLTSIDFPYFSTGASVVENLISDKLYSEKMNIRKYLSTKNGIQTYYSVNSDGKISVAGSVYAGGRINVGSSESLQNYESLFYGKNLIQEQSSIQYVSEESLLSGYSGGITVTNNYIYQFDDASGSAEVYFSLPYDGSRSLSEGSVSVSGLGNARRAASQNGYIYVVDSESKLYVLKEKNQTNKLRIVGQCESYSGVPQSESILDMISIGNFVVVRYSGIISVFDVSDPVNPVYIRAHYIESNHISFFNGTLQVLSSVSGSQQTLFFIDCLHGDYIEEFSIESDTEFLSLYRRNENILLVSDDGKSHYGVINRLDSTIEIDSESDYIFGEETAISETSLIYYGYSLFVFTNIGISIISMMNPSSPSISGYVTNSSTGFESSPFGISFMSFIIGNNVFYFRSEKLHTMSIKGSRISQLNSGSVSVDSIICHSNISVDGDASLGGIYSGGYLSVDGKNGITANSINANRIVINKYGFDSIGYKESDWSLDVSSGGIHSSSSRLIEKARIEPFPDSNRKPNQMVPFGNEVFVFAEGSSRYSIISYIDSDSPEIINQTESIDVEIPLILDSGIESAFSLGRYIYVENYTKGDLLKIDYYSRSHRNSEFLLETANSFVKSIVVGKNLFFARTETVIKYNINEPTVSSAGSYSVSNIKDIVYHEGKLVVLYVASGALRISSTEAASEIYTGSTLGTSFTGITESVVGGRSYGNYIYFATKTGGGSSVYRVMMSDSGAFGSVETIINDSSELDTCVSFDIFDDAMYFFKRDTESITVFSLSGEHLYSIDNGHEYISHTIYKNKIFFAGTDEDLRYSIIVYSFNKSNISVADFGSMVVGNMDVLGNIKIEGNGRFRSGMSSMNTISCEKEVYSTEGYTGQFALYLEKNTTGNSISNANLVATNLADQALDLFIDSDYVEKIIATLPEAYEYGDRKIILKIPGVYEIKFTGSVYRAIDGRIEIHLSVNDESVSSQIVDINSTAISSGQQVSCSFIAEIEAGDSVRILGIRSSSPVQPIVFSSSSVVSIEKIS